MFMGRHDYPTPSAPTAAWLSRLEAPCKQGVWFENSAHMIPWEEPGKLLVSLLEHVRPLVSDGDGADYLRCTCMLAVSLKSGSVLLCLSYLRVSFIDLFAYARHDPY